MAMTSKDGVQMDVPKVKEMGNVFGNIGDTLSAVNSTLEFWLDVLETTAFIGLVGGWAVVAYGRRLQPKIKKLAAECQKLKDDLHVSADAYESGDKDTTRFF